MDLFATDRDRLAFLLETDAALDLDLETLEALAGEVPEKQPPSIQPKYITNYIGSKQKLVDWIWKYTPDGVDSVVDAFSGSAVVAYMYKTKGLRVLANDRLRYCYRVAEDDDDPAAMGIWARAFEKASKLALLYSISENKESPSINIDAANWAWNFIKYQTRRMLYMVSIHAADNEFGEKCNRFIEFLTRWKKSKGDKLMPHWQMARRLKWSERDIEEVRLSLMSQRLIVCQQKIGPGPSGWEYKLP